MNPKPPPPFTKNRSYKWHEILTGLDAAAGPVYYILRKKGTNEIAAACLRIDLNPRAPYEILPENSPTIAAWADALAAHSQPVPVFVKEFDGKWYYRGRFKIAPHPSDPKQLRLRERQAKRRNIYKILFLHEVS